MIKWYAVQANGYDAWDIGSYDFDEAVRIGKSEMELENVDDFDILTINEAANCCELSVKYSEL